MSGVALQLQRQLLAELFAAVVGLSLKVSPWFWIVLRPFATVPVLVIT